MAGRTPARPKRLACKTAPKAGERYRRHVSKDEGLVVGVPKPPLSLPQLSSKAQSCPCSPLITINEHDLDHGDDEEGQSIHVHLHHGGSDEEHEQDSHQAAQDPNRLRDPGGEAGAGSGRDSMEGGLGLRKQELDGRPG